jgi:hypothetical protein
MSSTVDPVTARPPVAPPPSQRRRAAVGPRVRHAGPLVHSLNHDAVQTAVDRGAGGWDRR